MVHRVVRFLVVAAVRGMPVVLMLGSMTVLAEISVQTEVSGAERSGTALSAAVAEPAGTGIENIVVTASRIPIRAESVGSAVTVVSRPTIERRQAVHGAAVLQDVPGLAVSRLGGYGAQTQVRVRGAEANQVLVLIDGVKANDPAGSDEFDFSALTLYDVESLEVVRGPQSALWGSEATAGVINITTRPAAGPVASGFVEGGSEDTLYTGLRVGTGGSRGGIALNTSYYDTRGTSAAARGHGG